MSDPRPPSRSLSIVSSRSTSADGPPSHVDLAAERAVLGAVLLDNRTLPRIARTLDGPDDFYEPRHQTIWQAFLRLWNASEPIDVKTSVAELRAMERLNTIGGAQYLGELTDDLFTVAHCEAHARILADNARARRYLDALTEAAMILRDDGDPKRGQERAMARVSSVRMTRRSAAWRSMDAVAAEAWTTLIARREGQYSPVPTGFHALDGDPIDREDIDGTARDVGYLGGGLLAGELVVVAADQGGGKTAFALQLLRHAASRGFRALLVSQEMGGAELHWRFTCAVAGIPSTRVRAARLSEGEIVALQRASRELTPLPIRLCDTGAVSVSDLRVGALDALAEGPVHLIVVDYLQILDPPPGMDESSSAEVIDANARALKKLAREVGCPVVLLSQFNRAGQLAGRKPRIQDLKGSGGIESHADLVMVLHPSDGRSDGPAADDVDTDLLILKARGGPTGEVKLRFERRFTRFVEVATKRADDFPLDASGDRGGARS
ncbi:MAG: DnaB-like helicase C-terminal domain-containing protein [Polyangiales bacterium]